MEKDIAPASAFWPEAGADLATGPGEPSPRGGIAGLIQRDRVKPLIATVEGLPSAAAWNWCCTAIWWWRLPTRGQHPLVQCFLFGRFVFGSIGNGHFKALPGIPSIYRTQECRTERATAAW